MSPAHRSRNQSWSQPRAEEGFPEYHEDHEDHEYDYEEGEDLGFEYHSGYEGELFRDHSKKGQAKMVRNPRDNRNFPGNQPAGINGVTPKLLQFITGHVNQVSFEVQGPPPSQEDYP
jgi:hypothetical protein